MKSRLLNIILFLSMMITFPYANEQSLPIHSHPATDTYEGWKLGIQLWTFHKYTFDEAIEKTASLGVTWIEAFPGQVLSKDNPDVKFGHEMAANFRKKVLSDLAQKGLNPDKWPKGFKKYLEKLPKGIEFL